MTIKIKKAFIIGMKNNTLEKTKLQKGLMKKSKKSSWKKAEDIMKKTKRICKKWIVIDTKNYLKKKKIKKWNTEFY